MEINSIIIILGSPNSSSGVLSDIAISRLNLCLNTYRKETNCHILCTGGWGDQFNSAKESHAFYARNYLESKGVSEYHFLDFSLSSNTVEDALKTKEILVAQNFDKLIVITSDYHLERAKLIFDEILSDHFIEFKGAFTDINEEDSKKLMAHEQIAVHSILKNGLYY